MFRAILPLCALLLAAACTVAPAPSITQERQAVVAALADSTAGWNSGNLKRFMAVYSDGSDTTYVTPDGLVRGKQALADRYGKAYDFSDPAKRGSLSLETLDFRMLGEDYALYIGRYTLIYPDGKKASGPTSLVLAREEGGWRIVADHSS